MANPWAISLITGVISGFITGTVTCWFFYHLGGKDLERVTSHLTRRINELEVAEDMRQKYPANYERAFDKEGNPIGHKMNLRPAGIPSGEQVGAPLVEGHDTSKDK